VRILQIGATGQVGYALVRALAEAGHDLTVLVRGSGRLTFPDGIQVVTEREFTADAFRAVLRSDFDCVVYGAGVPEQFSFDTDIFDRVNHRLLSTFLTALEASTVPRLVYISTYEVFTPLDGVIRESHPVAPPAGLSPYFASMVRAYSEVSAFALRTGTRLTTIHPAAVYGGLATGDGITAAIENMVTWRVWRLPMVPPGRFPLVHADSLATGIVRSLLHQGPFIISDGMHDLHGLARALRRHTRSYVPVEVPAKVAYAAAAPIEAMALALRRRPILSRVQLDFITGGNQPLSDQAEKVLDFRPLTLHEGLARYLAERSALNAGAKGRRRPDPNE
jgi:nucleoside-diphosphate-sugar epimerase